MPGDELPEELCEFDAVLALPDDPDPLGTVPCPLVSTWPPSDPDEVVGDLSAPPVDVDTPTVRGLAPPDVAEVPDDELPEVLCEFDAVLALPDDPDPLGLVSCPLVSTLVSTWPPPDPPDAFGDVSAVLGPDSEVLGPDSDVMGPDSEMSAEPDDPLDATEVAESLTPEEVAVSKRSGLSEMLSKAN